MRVSFYSELAAIAIIALSHSTQALTIGKTNMDHKLA